MTEWSYDGDDDTEFETYEGCSVTLGWDQPWCYMHGGSNYSQYQNSSGKGKTRKWLIVSIAAAWPN